MVKIDELKKVVKGEVINDASTLQKYSGDASAFRVMPKVVVAARDSRDIQALVKYVSKNKKSQTDLSITPRAAGTDMTGGPLNESIILDVNRHLNKIIEIHSQVSSRFNTSGPYTSEVSEGEVSYVVVEPGVYFRDLESQIVQKGLYFPSYPASKSIAALGGMVANNAGGEKTLKHGKTEDYVLQLKVILADGNEYTFKKLSAREVEAKKKQKNFEGEVYRKITKLVKDNWSVINKARPKVSKNSTGYLLWNIWDREHDEWDLAQLFVGSQGTLGIIAEIKLKLLPIEKYSRLVAIYLYNLNNLSDIINKILQLGPTSLESYDDKTLKLAIRFAPQLAKMIGKEENLLKFGFKLLPDFWIMLTHGLPKLVLLVEFIGNDRDKVDERSQAIKRLANKLKLPVHRARDQAEAQKYWVIRRQSFNLLRKKIKGKQTVPFIDDFVIDPVKMRDFLPRLHKILNNYPELNYTIAGHAGDGNFHIIPLMDMTSDNQRQAIPRILEEVNNLVFQYNGSISGEHNEGLVRSPYMKQMYGDQMFKIFKEVKRIFDPQNIFNPHKKTDASLEYSLTHLKRDNEHEV